MGKFNNSSAAVVAASVLSAAVFAGCRGAKSGRSGLPTETRCEDFEKYELGEAPSGWTTAETHGQGTPASWRITRISDSPGGERCVAVAENLNRGNTFNLLIRDWTPPTDITISTSIRALAGSEDQGGGIVWRYRDENNYYLARWNPLEKNLRAYKVEGGARFQLSSANTDLTSSEWHRIEVVAQGQKFTVSLDGSPMLDFFDDTFRSAGRIGLWTKADSRCGFDQFCVTLAPAKER
jgi:hypothetical protein